jgi:hypothetical protein
MYTWKQAARPPCARLMRVLQIDVGVLQELPEDVRREVMADLSFYAPPGKRVRMAGWGERAAKRLGGQQQEQQLRHGEAGVKLAAVQHGEDCMGAGGEVHGEAGVRGQDDGNAAAAAGWIPAPVQALVEDMGAGARYVAGGGAGAGADLAAAVGACLAEVQKLLPAAPAPSSPPASAAAAGPRGTTSTHGILATQPAEASPSSPNTSPSGGTGDGGGDSDACLQPTQPADAQQQQQPGSIGPSPLAPQHAAGVLERESVSSQAAAEAAAASAALVGALGGLMRRWVPVDLEAVASFLMRLRKVAAQFEWFEGAATRVTEDTQEWVKGRYNWPLRLER